MRVFPLLLIVLLAGERAALALPNRVLLIGDSITAGVVSGAGGEAYASVLPALLGDDYEVVNAGCGGASSWDWTLSRPSALCGGYGVLPGSMYEVMAAPNLPAEIVSIMLGTNDASGFYEPQPVPVAEYRSALEEIVGLVLAEGAEKVILMPPPDHIWGDPTRRTRLIGYRAEILDLCVVTAGVVCGPDVFMLLDLARDFENWNLHPNARGHRAIAEALAGTIMAIPEPAPIAFLGLGFAAIGWWRRQRGCRSQRETSFAPPTPQSQP